MIFVNNALKKIGQEGLIINLKANNFYKGESLRPEDFKQLYQVLRFHGEEIELSASKKNNLFLCVLYYVYDTNPEAKEIYLTQFSTKYKERNTGGTPIELLHLIFNVIEMEIKIRQKDEKELKVLYNNLVELSQKDKCFEDYLLFKHYCAYLKFLLKSYEEASNYTTDLIVDIDDHKDYALTNFVKYIRVRNVLLKIRTLETTDPIGNCKDIISHLDCLFSWTKNTKEDFAITLGIKMLSLQSEEVFSYEECIRLIKDMLNILTRETMFGKTHKNILDQYLYLSGLLGYYSSLKDDTEQVQKATRKIDKYLENINEIMKMPDSGNNYNIRENSLTNSEGEIDKKAYENLYQKYKFFNVMLKSSINYNSNTSSKNRDTIKKQKESTQNLFEDDKSLLNLYLLEQNDLNVSTYFKNKEKEYKEKIERKKDIENNKIINAYFYLYNELSDLTKKVIDSLNEQSKLNDIKAARKYASNIIEYTNVQAIQRDNKYLKELFTLPFFKNLFAKLYFVKIYSYFLEGNYNQAIDELEKYEKQEKIQYELDITKINTMIGKIKGDCYFKLKMYQKAENKYSQLLGRGGENDDPLIYFNLGLCYYFNNNLFKAIDALEKAQELYKKVNNTPKLKIIETVLSKLKKP